MKGTTKKFVNYSGILDSDDKVKSFALKHGPGQWVRLLSATECQKILIN